MLWRRNRKAEQGPLRLLLWTAIAGLIFGAIGFGELAEDWLRVGRNSLHPHKASGDVVFVAIDDASLRQVGRWPWPRRFHAQMVDELSAAGAKRIFLDLMLENSSNRADDSALAAALKGSGNAVLGARARSGYAKGAQAQSQIVPEFRKSADVASLSVAYNYQNAVWRLPYGRETHGEPPSFAAAIANSTESGGSFLVDYSLDPATIPVISAADVLNKDFSPSQIAGKRVVIGTSSDAIGDQYFLPGWGKMGGAYIHIMGAETLKAGRPVDLGWLPAFLAACAASALAVFRRNRLPQNLIFAAATLVLLVVPLFTEAHMVSLDVTAGLFVLLCTASVLSWRRFRSRGLVNSVSGLPNLAALRSNRAGRKQALIVARVINYTEIAATLPPHQERQLLDQIIARLGVGAPQRTLYQGDGGVFAWFEEPRLPFGNHIEALYALFRNPARAGDLTIDLSVSFGVEIGSSRSLANRLASALVAAEEAAHDGLKWKYHDPETLEDASWKLSMLSQLDSAVDKGEVWVAFQPQLDLSTRRIVGAEALARWTHPEKGPISAAEFIAAAEQNDRIGKLTDFVLEEAIKAASALNRRQPGFGMAVNLSARLLSDKGFTLRLSAMLARHGLPADLLTLELTETAALAGSGTAVDMLASLRELGINISIDDYGTGLSTLDYLKKIPASEIKIDQSFVKSLLDNRSDRVMVQSTIGLAHSLGRKVVAEGIEQQAVLDALVDMGCDIGQGYIIGRPMSLESLLKRLSSARRTSAA